MPKGVKSTDKPLQKRIQELCNELLIVPAPKLVDAIQEMLLVHLTAETVIKAHKLCIQTPDGAKKPAEAKRPAQGAVPTAPGTTPL